MTKCKHTPVLVHSAHESAQKRSLDHIILERIGPRMMKVGKKWVYPETI